MRKRRIGAALATSAVATLILGVGWAPAAFAAVPTNDTIQTATEITSIPFSDSVNTTEGTTYALEASLQETCGAPPVEHGVWYHASVAESGNYTADTSQSDYGTGIMVLAGPVDSPTFLTCGPTSITGPLTADRTCSCWSSATAPPRRPRGTWCSRSRRQHRRRRSMSPGFAWLVRTGWIGNHLGHDHLHRRGQHRFHRLFGGVQQRVGRAFISNFLDAEPT